MLTLNCRICDLISFFKDFMQTEYNRDIRNFYPTGKLTALENNTSLAYNIIIVSHYGMLSTFNITDQILTTYMICPIVAYFDEHIYYDKNHVKFQTQYNRRVNVPSEFIMRNIKKFIDDRTKVSNIWNSITNPRQKDLFKTTMKNVITKNKKIKKMK